MQNLDYRAIGKGAAIAAVIAVPAGIVQNQLDRGTSAAFGMFLLVVLALVLGGFIAGREAPDRAMTHGGLAGLAVYVAVQALGIVLRLARGEAITWVSIPLVALLSLSCGVIGGYLAFRRGDDTADDDEDDDEATTAGDTTGPSRT